MERIRFEVKREDVINKLVNHVKQAMLSPTLAIDLALVEQHVKK